MAQPNTDFLTHCRAAANLLTRDRMGPWKGFRLKRPLTPAEHFGLNGDTPREEQVRLRPGHPIGLGLFIAAATAAAPASAAGSSV
jgi:hypothetical protein